MVSGDVPRYTKEVLRKKVQFFFRDFNFGWNIQRLLLYIISTVSVCPGPARTSPALIQQGKTRIIIISQLTSQIIKLIKLAN